MAAAATHADQPARCLAAHLKTPALEGMLADIRAREIQARLAYSAHLLRVSCAAQGSHEELAAAAAAANECIGWVASHAFRGALEEALSWHADTAAGAGIVQTLTTRQNGE